MLGHDEDELDDEDGDGRPGADGDDGRA